uniref:Uncharacterized protein n=1 Tax=Trichogramma kaykai TaxID=54128 RepID=A0ABD2WNW4_9HYME
MIPFIYRLCLAAALAGSALSALREYHLAADEARPQRQGGKAAHRGVHALTMLVPRQACATARSASWAPMPFVRSATEHNDTASSRPFATLQILPYLVDHVWQTLAIVYLLFFHVLILLALAFAIYLFADDRSRFAL